MAGIDVQLIAAFCVYAIVTSITPGPTNVMLLSSGLNFGFVRTTPHYLGVAAGFTAMVALVGLGLGAFLAASPTLYLAIKVLGIAYLLHMAWQLLGAAGVEDASPAAARQPMGFLGGAAFPLVNPKAWVMAIGAVGAYLPAGSGVRQVLVIAIIFGLINAPCMAVWAGFGQALRSALHRPGWRRAFNLTMAILLAASAYPIAVSQIRSH